MARKETTSNSIDDSCDFFRAGAEEGAEESVNESVDDGVGRDGADDDDDDEDDDDDVGGEYSDNGIFCRCPD